MPQFRPNATIAALSMLCFVLSGAWLYPDAARAEPMVQYFNTSWKEITNKLPELAEAGYESIWLPPPTKGSGGLSVGYDLWDRFDLGSKDQRGSVSTRYGTEADLLQLVRVAHRFGIRVYFDNIMNHNAFDVPGFNESVPVDVYPGLLPEDFHLRVTEEGFYQKWDNTRNWGDAWQVQNLGLSDLIDIAHENPNTNFGRNEGDDHPKITFVRHPDNPEYYFDTDLPQGTDGDGITLFTFADKEPFTDSGWGAGNTGAGNGRFDWDDTNSNGQHDNGETSEPFVDLGLYPNAPSRQSAATGAGDGVYNMGNPVAEDVNAMLIRAARWLFDRTHVDGLRLDAVKHVPDYFFGQLSGPNKDRSGAGYNGGSQTQFNLTRGFSDWNNHRDSVFSTEIPRDDAMLFGEHLGQPPGFGGYIDSGMRLVDNDLRSKLNSSLGNPFSGINGLDGEGSGGFAAAVAVTHAQSHDNDFAAMRELQHAIYFTRAGLPLVYTDGNYQAETLSQSGGAFPRHSNTNFLGQFGDPRLPNLMKIHQAFARGFQTGTWSTADLIAYERRDDRENPGMSDADEVTAIILVNDNTANGQAPGFGFSSAFPPGAYLYQYAVGPAAAGDSMTGFYVTMEDAGGGRSFFPGGMLVPRGGYYVFSWRTPEPAPGWANGGGKPITIYQNGAAVGSVTVSRRDGPDGDPGYNPHGLPDADPTDFTYEIDIPRVTDGTNLDFVTRVDGSAADVLMKLDGGIDLNGNDPGLPGDTGTPRDSAGTKRDFPPGYWEPRPGNPGANGVPYADSTDVYLGYEATEFRERGGPEKFAAVDRNRSTLGSQGAETFITTVGSGVVNRVDGPTTNNPTPNNTIGYIEHDPDAQVDGEIVPTTMYDDSGPLSAVFWIRTQTGLDGYFPYLYYTNDSTNPEGAAGDAAGSTQVMPMTFVRDAGGHSWFKAEINPKPSGEIRYKLSSVRKTAGGNALGTVFPGNAGSVTEKLGMMSVYQITDFDATTVQYRPHNDHGDVATGLDEGFHIIRARAFLDRFNRASLYNTFTQTFYYDAQPPSGEILFPGENDTLTGQNFGVVVRTDPSVTEVWYQIVDSDATNDDSSTGVLNGNGPGFEPFTDANNNGVRDGGEPFEDLDNSGDYTANLSASWVRATDVTLTPNIGGNASYTKEWRFNYNNVASSGAAQIHVRLREISSADREDFTDTPSPADDTAKHYTTLTRNVTAEGPNIRMFVAFPQQDGDVVNDSYTMKAYFSKALGDGISDQQLLSEFLIKIGSTISGTNVDAVTQNPAAYSIVRNETADYHALAFTFPNLFNGDPDFLHHVEVTHNRSGSAELSATRLVKAAEVNDPFVNIVTPLEFDGEGRPFEIVLPDVAAPTADQRSTPIIVETDTTAVQVDIVFEVGSGTVTLDANQPETIGTKKRWAFTWSNMIEGVFRFRADMRQAPAGPVVATDTRNATVVFRESSASVAADPDDDDDGLLDADELTPAELPQTNPETWTNGEVHVYNIYGRTNPLSSDTDGDGLPDATESGWRIATVIGEAYQDVGFGNPAVGANNGVFDFDDANADGDHDPGEASEPFTDSNSNNFFDYGTILTADTNGDGVTNFVGDRDPPFYNTVPDNNGLPNYNFNAGRLDLIHGTLTDPTNPDTDGDGIDDGVEDADKDGHVDGDGDPLDPNEANPNNRGAWPNGQIDGGETWAETDPNNPDTDGDFLSDGTGEDKNGNGVIDGDTNGDRVYQAGEAWTETDPLKNDTDGDGLLDGWEVQNGLDPLDNGTDNLRTAAAGDGDVDQGAAGDPDSDTFSNATEQTSGTKPLVHDSSDPPPASSIVIGPGAAQTVGLAVNGNEFTDWTCEDIVALDEYEGDGFNNQSGDTFPAGDGFDSSRDIVAFYFRDGGADGKVYFRVDMYDLAPFAEDGNLDIYVAIDTGNPALGEFALPDKLDIGTEMRWEMVVAAYHGGVGHVYVDTDSGTNSIGVNEDLAANGVVVRNQNIANGFVDSYYNSELDAVEFSIRRQALLDAGWNGSSALNFQVFTTRDGTQNDGTGLGDLGRRNDIRDTIYDDWLAEDYWSSQQNVATNGKLATPIPQGADRCKRAKLILLTHGNQPIRPGSETQDLINTGFSTGYHRTIDAHQAFGEPLTLHLTPTLASAIEWASVDPALGKPWRDGPAFNARIAALRASGGIDMLGSTFSDHMIGYNDAAFNADNIALANDFISGIYGAEPSTKVFWNPERVADDGVLAKIDGLGFDFTFVDQMRHIFKWFGRNSALSDDGYRINEVDGLKLFVINDQASTFRYQNFDNGLALPLRNLFSRKSRSGTQDQVVVLFHRWEEFADFNSAAAYDRNLRWIANTPWVEVVTPSAIAAGEVDFTGDSVGDVWPTVNRGAPSLANVSQDYVDHATQENYDNWYNGQAGREEGLRDKVFEIRPGTNLPEAFGDQSANDALVADDAWDSVMSLTNRFTTLGRLGRGTAHASFFQTAFHNQSNNDLSKFSNGSYISPDTDFNTLADLAAHPQSQTRFAAIYKRVETWNASPPSSTQTVAAQEDIDLDGENEFLIYNNQVFAMFERIGGRMTGAWSRNTQTNKVYQTVGNFLSYPNSATEEEGAGNNVGVELLAHRTSGFKDWAYDSGGGATGAFVNDLYAASAAADGWTFTSSGGEITKTITLAPNSANLAASYSLAGAGDTLYVRFGLSPNLYDLLLNGQANLGQLTVDPNLGLRLTNSTADDVVTANVGLNGANHVAAAIDDAPGTFDADTVKMRNQAQTEQVEIVNTAQTFTINFNLGNNSTDDDGDGLATNWEIANGLDPLDDGTNHVDNGANGDPDGDGIPNIDEQGNGQNPNQPNAAPVLTVGSLDGDYTTTKLYVDEIAGDSIPIVVRFSPGDSGTITDVECVTNLNQRHRADGDKNANGISDGQEWNQVEGIIGPAGDDTFYYQTHPMAPTATPGEYSVTLNATKCGAYRLTARWKVSGDPNWRQYTIYGRRDHAVTVAPTDARNVCLYEINTLTIEAAGGGFANRSTFEDLHDAAGALRTADGKGFNLDYLEGLGVNWLWFQPVHPPAVVGRETDPATGQPYDHGSPYAIKNFFEIDPAMSAANTRPAAMTAFQNFVAAADAKQVEIMLDAPFNHTGFDVELGQRGIDLFQPDGQTWAATDEIRNREARFFSRGDIFNVNANDYCQRASGAHNMTNAPDRGDFGKWGDVVDVFFGRYDSLVCQNPGDNLAYLNEGDGFWYQGSNWVANDFVQGGQNQNVTRNVWKYFRDYALHWLDQTGYPAGTQHTEANRNVGIDGLRCDFGQGLPPQAWEYIINTARTRKWNFVMMSESLDGGAVTYRSNRHFDVLNENIVFPLKNAATAADYRTIFEDRRNAYGQGLVLLNNTSHDEENYVDPFEALIRYSVAGTIDGVPLIFMGQELGISRTFGFTFYETNFGKEIGHFKKYNSLQPIWSDTNFGNDQLYEVYAGINAARKVSPALRSSNRFFMDGEGGNNQIHAVAKYEGGDVVLAFANLDRDNDQSDTFKITGALKGLLGIDDNRTYNVKNIAAFEGQTAGRRDQFLWADDDADANNGVGLKGSTLESAGFFVGLKKVPTTNGDWTTAPFEAQYLQLIDVTPAPAPALTSDLYTLGANGTVNWTAGGVVDHYVISIGTTPGGTDLIDNQQLPNSATSYNFNGIAGILYYVTLVAHSGASQVSVSETIHLLDPDADNDADGRNNAVEDAAGDNPLDPKDGNLPVILRMGANYEITVSTTPGRRYTLQTSTDLLNWANVGDPDTVSFTAVETATTFVDLNAVDGRRFYRVVEEVAP